MLGFVSHYATLAMQNSTKEQVSFAPCKKVAAKHPGDVRSAMTLSPTRDKDLFNIHSNPETMTYQSLNSL